jgi:streptogramin lyase
MAAKRRSLMRSGCVRALAMMVICITWVLTCAAAPAAELTMWTMPYEGAYPGGLAIDQDGRVYVAASGGREIYRLDPATDSYCGWGVGERPQDVTIADGVVFCTVQGGNTIVYFDPAGQSVNTAPIPFSDVGPREIHRGPNSADGKLVFWIGEWNAPGVLRYEYDPALDAPDVIGTPTERGAVQTVATVLPAVVSAEHERFSYDVTLMPDPEPLPAAGAERSFTEWAVPIANPPGVWDIAAAEDGTLWISCSMPFLYRLDPIAGSIQGLETIQDVIIASGLLPASDGSIWFGNILRGAIGHFDPALGLSEVWRIPWTGEVYDLVFGPDGAIWYTDRVADAVGRLDIVSNEATVYLLPWKSEPLLLAFDADGALWFTASSGNYIGRLVVTESGKLEP